MQLILYFCMYVQMLPALAHTPSSTSLQLYVFVFHMSDQVNVTFNRDFKCDEYEF